MHWLGGRATVPGPNLILEFSLPEAVQVHAGPFVPV